MWCYADFMCVIQTMGGMSHAAEPEVVDDAMTGNVNNIGMLVAHVDAVSSSTLNGVYPWADRAGQRALG